MDYISLVNFAIEESGLELDLLDDVTWDSYVAGRRVYPRLKRYVQQSWKQIQISRNQWEFASAKVSQMVYPRFKYEEGLSSSSYFPSVGDEFIGVDSGFRFTVLRNIGASFNWLSGDGTGQLEFTTTGKYQNPQVGEIFVLAGDPDVTFVFTGRGSYDFGLDVASLAEIKWDSFIILQPNSTPVPGVYVPYKSWMFDAYDYAEGTSTPPSFLSQDFEGNVVFLHQSYIPFRVSFIYAVQPQVLTDYFDVPRDLPEAYHEWIAWEAVKRIATYDKNPQLYAHAERNAVFYKNRAETNLMPVISWGSSKYNE